jgi:fibro-slime domain-containing protein
MFKSSVYFVLVVLFSLSSVFANLNGKTIMFFNAWKYDSRVGINDVPPLLAEEISYSGIKMTDVGNNWLSYDIKGIRKGIVKFKFKISLNALAKPGVYEETSFVYKSDFAGADTLYISFKPGSPGKLMKSTSRPKAIYLLTPWETSAPAVNINGEGLLNMFELKGPKLCGWFVAYYFGNATEIKAAFEDVNFGEAYGAKGIGDAAEINLTPYLTGKDSVFVLPEPQPDGPPTYSSWHPGPFGACTYEIGMIVRDFNSNHPDFEYPISPSNNPCKGDPNASVGMVKDVLPPNKRPEKAKDLCVNSEFEQWFNDVKDVNYTTCRNITFQRNNLGQWVFDAYYHPEDPADPSTADKVFFPINDFDNPNNQKFTARYDKDPKFTGAMGYGNAPGKHNFHFCDETHAQFIYQEGQVFDFRGDDDVWIFINNKLAVDLGGVHPPLSKTINLKNEASKLGLTPGEKYDFDLYHCERHTDGSSLRIRTSIFFKQNKEIECPDSPVTGGVEYQCLTLSSGEDQSCAGAIGGGGGSQVPSTLEYRLIGGGLDTTIGTSYKLHFGGLNLKKSSFIIIDDDISGLGPGRYKLEACQVATSKCEYAEFEITGTLSILAPDSVAELAGNLVMVEIANGRREDIIQMEVDYSLTGNNIGNLKIYTDAEGLNELDGDATTNPNGLDTLWVTLPLDTKIDQELTYNLEVYNGVPQPKPITFYFPRVQWQDGEDGPEQNGEGNMDAWKYAYVSNKVWGQLVWGPDAKPCTECENDVMTFASADSAQLFFKLEKEGEQVTEITVGDFGKINFLFFSADPLTGASMTLQGSAPLYKGEWIDITLVDPPVPKITPVIFDDNGDGIADRLKLTFTEDNIKDTLPVFLSYYWQNKENGDTLNQIDLAANVSGASTIEITGSLSSDIYTGPLGEVTWKYLFEGESLSLFAPIIDSVPPVIAEARVQVSGSTILTLTFSEQIISSDSLGGEGINLFRYFKKKQSNSRDNIIPPASISFDDSAGISKLRFTIGEDPTAYPVSGDSVRIFADPQNPAGYIKDVGGVLASENSPYREILGDKIVLVQNSGGLISVGGEDEVWKEADASISQGYGSGIGTKDGFSCKVESPICVYFIDPQELPNDTAKIDYLTSTYGGHGFFLGTEVWESVQEFSTDPEKDVLAADINLSLSLDIFSNLGSTVASFKGSVACDDDKIFGSGNDDGNCLKNLRAVWIRWNGKGEFKQFSTGVFLAKFKYDVSNGSDSQDSEEFVKWGIRRSE